MLKQRAALLLAIPAFALAACGGDSDEDKIKDIINDGSENPQTICDHATDKLLQQVGGSVDACKTAAKEAEEDEGGDTDKPDSIDVSIDGDKATAKFEDKDGDNTVQFVKDGDEWKIDAVS
jgi:hypothetical protein